MYRQSISFVLFVLHFMIILGRPDRLRHYGNDGVEDTYIQRPVCNEEEVFPEYWINQAQQSLGEKLSRKPITNIAKNVILFLGDGMSITTLAAARTYLGQANGKFGEETYLSFEQFPYTGLSKTYCVTSQVADSACSATAYLCGVKANEGTIGVSPFVPLGGCNEMQSEEHHLSSIARWSQLKGKRTGLVTTTRVTHASPAGTYAHTAHRDWENDADVVKAGFNPNECPDIAFQLIHGTTGNNLNVILGGGRGEFIPKSQKDEEGLKGSRSDERNLIEEWKLAKKDSPFEYVWNRTSLSNVKAETEYLLGLFDKSHMDYNMDRDPVNKPSLEEMVQTAIRILSQGDKGYFLFVEGGRIDHAHHDTLSRKALNETVEFHKAVQAAVDATSREDTLIVVTSDHAHTMTLNGYPQRGNDILGIAGKGSDDLPYTTLSYANGPGYRKEENGQRHDVSEDDLSDKEYEYPALAPKSSETHGGEDVGIFALGPWAHLFTGVMEQNVIPHLMAYTSCVGNGKTVCD